MRLFEYDAKGILQEEGFPIPKSILINNTADIPTAIEKIGFPFILKAQTLIGGRGKVGGIQIVRSFNEAKEWCEEKIGKQLKGRKIVSVLAEELVDIQKEYYLSFKLDTHAREIIMIFSSNGGVNVEDVNDSTTLLIYPISIRYGIEDYKLVEILSKAHIPTDDWPKFIKIMRELYSLFWKLDCELLEVNPLVLTLEGNIQIVDVHLYVDDNAIPRQTVTRKIINGMPGTYPQLWYKTNYGFDFVELNPLGTIGLITTGAGLTMATIDELKERGLEPINFSDIRSGQLRGDPTRLVLMLEKFKECKNLSCIFVSIFAGITDLAEFVETLLKAKNQVSFSRKIEWIIRLEGNNFQNAKRILENKGLFVSNSLEESLKQIALGGVRK